MKKQILSIALGLVTMAIATTTYAADKNSVTGTDMTINKQEIKDFASNLGNSTSTISPSKDGSIVHSVVNGNAVTSAYDKKGNLVYTIERHTAVNLLKNVMDIVKESHYDYYISGMEKVDIPGFNTVYIVHIEDQKTIKTLRVSNGEVQVMQDFERG